MASKKGNSQDKEDDIFGAGGPGDRATFFLPEDLNLPEAAALDADEVWVQMKKNVRNVMKLNAVVAEEKKEANMFAGIFSPGKKKKHIIVKGAPGPDCSKCGKKIHYAIICPYCGRVQ